MNRKGFMLKCHTHSRGGQVFANSQKIANLNPIFANCQFENNNVIRDDKMCSYSLIKLECLFPNTALFIYI